MSTLSGHFRITNAAVVELASGRPGSTIAQGVRWAGLPGAAVGRDIMDVLCLGHWADFGQSHHFMRRFDSQSPFEAYEAALHWIHSNSLSAVKLLANRIAIYFPKGIRDTPADRIRGRFVFQDVPWQSLGNAIHCLEDSFAIGHAVRSESEEIFAPGEIEHIKRYAGEEKKDHEEGDELWWDNSEKKFSTSGRQAIEAVKALLRMVLDNATGQQQPHSLVGWQAFCHQWLRASSKLSRTRDRVFELIDKHYTGVRLGANNLVTLNYDEQALASDLFLEPMQTVFEAFRRLDEHYNTDADDVAELYVNKIRSAGEQKIQALKGNKPLITLLIKVLDEGWTSQSEKDCITFLKSL